MKKKNKTLEEKLSDLIEDLLDNADKIEMDKLLAKIQIGKIAIDYLKIKRAPEDDTAEFLAELEEKTKILQTGGLDEEE